MQDFSYILNQSEQEQSKQTLDVEEEDCQAVNVTDGFQKHDSALELKGNVGFNVQVNGKDAVSREEQAAIKIQQAFQGHLVGVAELILQCPVIIPHVSKRNMIQL
jgi:hypothetical protein